LARHVARESMVLLKNEGGMLPLPKSGRIAVIGALAKKPRYQGGGSSHVKPTKLEDISEELAKSAGLKAEIVYAQGYELDSDATNRQFLVEAVRAAQEASVAVIFAELPERYESEGFDRTHLGIPGNQSDLIEAIAAVQNRVVVVLSNGSAVEMPWLGSANAVLEAYLGGQALGGAIADLLFGDANPCGKLAETFPMQLSDNPSYLFFPGEGDRVEYKEGLFVGYRYYDKKKQRPQFPFGHGLSYTSFEYTDLRLDKTILSDMEELQVSVTVRNIGSRAGKEIVQLYVRDVESYVVRPDKELKGFVKVYLEPGEAQNVSFTLSKSAFAYYNVELKDWHVETGKFEILIGQSSNDIVLKDSVTVQSTVPLKKKYTINSTVGDLMVDPNAAQIAMEIVKQSPFAAAGAETDGASDMMAAFLRYLPLRALAAFSGGAVSEEQLDSILFLINSNPDDTLLKN
jgi:beta-glucosidase